MLALLLVEAQEARHVRQDRVLAEVVLDHLRHVGVDDLVVGHTRTGRIGQTDLALDPRAHQALAAEDRVRIERFRIEEQIVDAAIDDIDALQAIDGPHVRAVVVTHDEVRAFDQFDTHLLREIGMLEVRGVVDARGQQHDVRRITRTRADRHQRVVELGGVVVDRQDVRGVEQFRPDALDDRAVLQHVRDTGRHPQVVFEHIQGAVAIANQIGAADVRPDAVLRRDADALLTEVHRLGEDLGREDAVLDDLLLAVQILDEVVQRGDALLQAAFGLLPFLLWNDSRNDVERPGAVDILAFGIDREGDAHDLDRQIGRQAAIGEILLRQALQVLDEATGGGSCEAGVVEEFVVGGVASILAPVECHADVQGISNPVVRDSAVLAGTLILKGSMSNLASDSSKT